MDRFASSSGDRADTSGNTRFTSQGATAEDLLKAQTVGLVNLNDYRKRRAEALDRKERGETAVSSGASTPVDGYGDSMVAFRVDANLQSTGHQRQNPSLRRSAR
jgi:protein FAM50